MPADVVVATGTASGIGSALADRLVAAGVAVIGIDRHTRKTSPAYRHITFDLAQLATDTTACPHLLTQLNTAREALAAGRIVGLVNNAAEQIVTPALRLDVAEFRRTMDVNVLAPFVLSQLLHAELAVANGVIVNVGSVHSRLTKPGFCAYSTSKAAMSGLSRALTVEWGRRVRVVTLELAAVSTPMLESGFAGRPESRARLDESHPSGEIGTPGQVAEWVCQLVLARYPFANGAVLHLDGGISCRLHDPD